LILTAAHCAVQQKKELSLLRGDVSPSLKAGGRGYSMHLTS
jgi:hypothetical protein